MANQKTCFFIPGSHSQQCNSKESASLSFEELIYFIKSQALFLLPTEIATFVSFSEIIKKRVRLRKMCFSQVFLKAIEYYKSALRNYAAPLQAFVSLLKQSIIVLI